MPFRFVHVAVLFCLALSPISAASPAVDMADIITRDVVIVGGGASGAHAAVKLRDLGKTVVLVEKRGELGGHTRTIWEPDRETGSPFTTGVTGWTTYGNQTDFITRMKVATEIYPSAPVKTEYADLATGQSLEAFVPPSKDDVIPALKKYVALVEQYDSMLLPGYFNFPQPGEIPEDLMLPFKDFVKKHDIAAVAPLVFAISAMAMADIMNTLTLFVIQAVPTPCLRAFTGEEKNIRAVSGSNQELYERIGEFLGKDVLYNTTVVASSRDSSESDANVVLAVRNSNGGIKLIKAKRLLVAMQPSPSNMAPFDLDESERKVFSQLQYSRIVAGGLKIPEQPNDFEYRINNRPATADPSDWTAFPPPPFIPLLSLHPKPKGILRFSSVGKETFDETQARKLVVEAFNSLAGKGSLQGSAISSPEFAYIEDFGPIHVHVNASDVKNGFIQDLYGLQGRRSTWWTGAAFSAQATTVLWALNDELVPRMVAGLDAEPSKDVKDEL